MKETIDPVRHDDLSASMEDYLEAILRLERTSRVARVGEIAEYLSVSQPSVTGALRKLSERGLVTHARYGYVVLTEQGEEIALAVDRRHTAIRDFLIDVLDVPAEQADINACRLEHVLDDEIIARLIGYAERIKQEPRRA